MIDNIPAIDNIKDEGIRQGFQHLLQKAQGKVLELSAAPTSDAPLLQMDEWGYYSHTLYHRISKTNIEYFTATGQITIT